MVEVWFAILCLTLIAYTVMDGWNIGCGVVQFLVTRSQAERRLVIAAIGPLWTWHEVWLVAAGGVLFVAFPGVIGVALSGFYLAVFLLLWCVLGRGLSLEFGGHIDDPMWRTFWDVAFTICNLLIAILLGAAIGNLIRGLPIGPSGKFSLPLFTHFRTTGDVGILDWYTIAVALFTLVCLSAHGASYLVWRTEGAFRERVAPAAKGLWIAVFVLLVPVTFATAAVRPGLFEAMAARPLAWIAVVVAIAGAIAVLIGQRDGGRDALAFAGGSIFMSGLLGAAAASVFPVMLYSTFDPAHSITAHAGAAGGAGMGLAIVWWPVALILSIVYGAVVFKQFGARVRLSP
jgi:cytochrome bd ubiquinol oxidase subunit II